MGEGVLFACLLANLFSMKEDYCTCWRPSPKDGQVQETSPRSPNKDHYEWLRDWENPLEIYYLGKGTQMWMTAGSIGKSKYE